METEKTKCYNSKHIVIGILAMIVVGLSFGVVGYLLGSKGNNAVSDNNSTKNAVVNQNNEVEKEEIKNKEEKELKNIKDETADWMIYENDIYNYTVSYPSDWQIEKEAHLGDYAPMISSPEDAEIHATLMITANYDANSFSIKQEAENDKWFIKKIISEEDITIGDMDGYMVRYIVERGGLFEDIVIQRIYLIHNNRAFNISYEEQKQTDPYAYVSDYEKWTYKNILNQMISTFQFTDSKDKIGDFQTYTNND